MQQEARWGFHVLNHLTTSAPLLAHLPYLPRTPHLHRLLQALLGLPVPRWHHHPLLVEAGNRKLAKRRGSSGLDEMRLRGEDGQALADALRAHRFPAGISLGHHLD